ncbi:hypothetical protein, partial [Halomonas marinisediminis]
ATGLFEALATHITEKRKTSQVVIASWSEGARERLRGLLEDQDLSGLTEIARLSDIPEGTGGVHLLVWALDEGFEGPDHRSTRLTVISEQDVL